jgi:hypothetical protein
LWGSNSSIRLFNCVGSRVSTSFRYAQGSCPLSLADYAEHRTMPSGLVFPGSRPAIADHSINRIDELLPWTVADQIAPDAQKAQDLALAA